jgi:cysteine-rich repeat protein
VNSDTAPDACRTTCRPARCGDGTKDAGEACDDGNAQPGDGCTPDCRSTEYCGNGYVDVIKGEVCDDGAANSDTLPDACRTTCHPARCGDGTLDTGEACDQDFSAAPDRIGLARGAWRARAAGERRCPGVVPERPADSHRVRVEPGV